MLTDTSLEFHPAANLFPMLTGDEYEQLKADIAANGQLEPIWIHPDGRILDGRNRYMACCDLGIEPKVRQWNGGGSAVGFVVSLNIHRRHLTASQLAIIANEALPMYEAEAKARMLATQNNQAAREIVPQQVNGKAVDQAAKDFGTNGRYVQDAKVIQTVAPDLAAAVKSGDMTIPQAKREITARQKKDAPPMPSDKYRVVYADPPWSYGNTMPDYMGVQDDHYPTMTVKEVCGLPVREMVEDNAVLFLWVTSPILPESFDVVRAWGFEYKASFVWDKVKHVMGHYNSVRHEILLVCVRGSCQPDVPKLFDSVQTIERGAHSTKPEEFRTIIDTIYPYGRRIELFARRNADGWETWGNESTD